MNHHKMKIGEAAAHAGVSAKAVRLYERKGLIEPPERTAAGYRTYAPDDVATLQFIRQAKTIGLTLDDIKRIIDLQRDGQQPCSTVIELLDQRIEDIDTKLADLEALRESLSGARQHADAAVRSGKNVVVCHIIESTPNLLNGPEREPAPPSGHQACASGVPRAAPPGEVDRVV